MPVGFHTTMPVLIDELFTLGPRRRTFAEYQPPEYSSLKGWMFLNYALLSLLIATPILSIYDLLTLIR